MSQHNNNTIDYLCNIYSKRITGEREKSRSVEEKKKRVTGQYIVKQF